MYRLADRRLSLPSMLYKLFISIIINLRRFHGASNQAINLRVKTIQVEPGINYEQLKYISIFIEKNALTSLV